VDRRCPALNSRGEGNLWCRSVSGVRVTHFEKRAFGGYRWSPWRRRIVIQMNAAYPVMTTFGKFERDGSGATASRLSSTLPMGE
jgi:hypothetical protein